MKYIRTNILLASVFFMSSTSMAEEFNISQMTGTTTVSGINIAKALDIFPTPKDNPDFVCECVTPVAMNPDVNKVANLMQLSTTIKIDEVTTDRSAFTLKVVQQTIGLSGLKVD